MKQASSADKEKIIRLNKQLTDIQSKLQSPAAALKDYKQKLAISYKTIDNLKHEVLPEQLKQAKDSLKKGETGNAEILLARVLKQGRNNSAEAAFELSQLALARVDYANAYQYAKEAVELQPNNSDYLTHAGRIAFILRAYTEAESFYQRALVVLEKTLGHGHYLVAEVLRNLALVYSEQGDYHKSMALSLRSLNIREKVLGLEHPDVASTLSILGLLYYEQGMYTEAEIALRRALTITEKNHIYEHPLVGTILNNLGLLYRDKGDNDKAEPFFQRALIIAKKTSGQNHPDVASILSNLGDLNFMQGYYTKAEPFFLQSLIIDEKTFGNDHPIVQENLRNYAATLRALNRLKEAEKVEAKITKTLQ